MPCLFCDIIDNKIPAKIIYKDEKTVAFHDINPQAPIHILIIPREHIETINAINEKNKTVIADIYLAAKKIALQLNIAEDGYRTVVNCNANAGQDVFHIHLHLLAGRKMHWPPG